MIAFRFYYRIAGFLLMLAYIGCSNGNAQQKSFMLKPADFSVEIKNNPTAPLIDVRTAEEFNKGHLENAVNINWNGNDFGKNVMVYDKNKPVFIYCLSGGRSSSAASFLRKNGFKEVYELEGGIIKWRSAGLPEAMSAFDTAAGKTMTMDQYRAILKSDKYVLVDFYADWCRPCKEMKPHLDRLASEHSDKVTVVRVNADDNKALLSELRVDELPTLYLYKNELITWRHIGFIDLNGLLSQLQ